MEVAPPPPWRRGFEVQFRALTAEAAGYRELVAAHAQLLRQHSALRTQQHKTETQLLIVQHEHKDSTTGKAVQQLEEQVKFVSSGSTMNSSIPLGRLQIERMRKH